MNTLTKRGLVNQELLLQNEYLAAENRVLRAHLPARLRLSDPERSTLAEIGKRLGRKALAQVACVAKPDTILAWYRKLITQKFDGSKYRRYPTTTWKEFIQSHMAVLAGIDFFTVEVLTWRGLVTYYILFFIHLESRRVSLAGITRHPDQAWMQQMARNATGDAWGFLNQRRYALHDRDTKFCSVFRATLAAWWYKTDSTPGAESKPECLRREMGAIGERGMLIQTNLVRRSLAATRPDRSFSPSKETTKARTTLCSSLPPLRLSPVGDLASTVESASAAYFGITVAPHEYFDQTG
jgi:hypothetical protein